MMVGLWVILNILMTPWMMIPYLTQAILMKQKWWVTRQMKLSATSEQSCKPSASLPTAIVAPLTDFTLLSNPSWHQTWLFPFLWQVNFLSVHPSVILHYRTHSKWFWLFSCLGKECDCCCDCRKMHIIFLLQRCGGLFYRTQKWIKGCVRDSAETHHMWCRWVCGQSV